MRAAILLPLAMAAGSAGAAAPKPAELQAGYVRARAAEIGGDTADASKSFAALLAADPANATVAARGLRQALVGGNMALAVRAARTLQAAGKLPPDGAILLGVAALEARDWRGVELQAEALGTTPFAFTAPYLRAWAAVARGQGDPLTPLGAARALPLAQPYVDEQRGLLLIAAGKVEEGVAVLRRIDRAGIAGRATPVRLAAADALARTGERTRALALIEGREPVLAAARARIEQGERLGGALDGARGFAMFLVRVAADFDRERLTPIALALARYATLSAPQDGTGWLLTAELLGRSDRTGPALDAVAKVRPTDPMASAARTLRIALLVRSGQAETALAEARAAAAQTGADSAEWIRVGDVETNLNHHAAAAEAYGRALAAADAAKLPADRLWPIWLQRGSALDQAGDWPGGKAALERAYALAPDEAVVLNQLGYSQIARRDNVTGATRLIERASALRPDDPAITDSLGWVRFLGGNAGAAVPLLEKAAAGDPGEPTINEHLGDALWTLGREREARFAWRAAVVTAEDKDRARLTLKLDQGLQPATMSP
jgi:tetratricopeptide (TPR) repeat protein